MIIGFGKRIVDMRLAVKGDGTFHPAREKDF
jgi:hypothetical protein